MSQNVIHEGFVHLYSGRRHNLNRPWEKILHLARRYVYPNRGILSLAGSMKKDFYYISRGRLSTQVFSGSGRERSVLFFEEGCLFNLAMVMLDVPDTGEWFCHEETIIWRFSGSMLRDEAFVREHPDLIINLMEAMCFNILSQYTWLTEMYLANPLLRFCRYLTGLHAESGGKLRFSPGVTQQEAANELGMHRATLAAALKELRDAGIVAGFTKNSLHILDLDRLKELAYK